MRKTKKKKKATARKFVVAAKNLDRLERKIAPFVRRSKTRVFTTAGAWRDDSSASSEFESEAAT